MPTPRWRRGPRDKRRETQDENVHPERVWIRPAAETPRRPWHDLVPFGWPNLLLSCGRSVVDTLGTAGLGSAHTAGHGKCRRFTGSLGRNGANATGTNVGMRGLAKPLGLAGGEGRRRRGCGLRRRVVFQVDERSRTDREDAERSCVLSPTGPGCCHRFLTPHPVRGSRSGRTCQRRPCQRALRRRPWSAAYPLASRW